MTKTVSWATVIATVAVILQSALLSRFAVFRAVPDLALCVVVYVAYLNGTMTGQVTGFAAGIAQDFISASPLGFNAFIRTAVGAAAGLLKGTFFLDVAVLPATLCASATLLKAAAAWIAHVLFAGAVPAYSLTAPTLWVEIALNAVSAPFVFAFLNLFKTVLKPRRQDS